MYECEWMLAVDWMSQIGSDWLLVSVSRLYSAAVSAHVAHQRVILV